MPQIKFEKKFGQSPVFIASTLLEDGGVPPGATSASLLKEAIHVISCGYEDKSEWGKEVCTNCIKMHKFLNFFSSMHNCLSLSTGWMDLWLGY